MPSTAARVNYPELPDPLTPGDVRRLFSPIDAERGWAPTIARRPESQVALPVHLKIFQTIGRYLPATQIPPAVVERVSQKMGCEVATAGVGAKRTLHRHRVAIDSQSVLELVRNSDCSACDCEFIALAANLGSRLVTMDRKLLNAFPSREIGLSAV